MKPKLFVIGIDSATWTFIDRWIKSNDLPNFKKVTHSGASAQLLSTTPPLTPVAWNTFYTGLNPGEHGIMDFYTLDTSHNLRFYTAKDRHGKTFWQELDKKGYTSCIYNLPCTFPPEKLHNGIVFSGFTTPSSETEFITPKAVLKEFKKKFPKYIFNEDKRYDESEQGREEFFQSLVNLTKKNIEVSNWLFKKKQWDLFATNFMTVDHVQHWFWKYNDSTYPGYDKNKSSKYKDKILRIYQLIDEYIGEMLPILKKKNYNIMILSDHGAGPHYKNVYINNLLKKEKLLFLKKTPNVMLKQVLSKVGITPHTMFRLGMKFGFSKKGSSTEGNSKGGILNALLFTFNDIDWQRTKAYSFGYYGNIHFNNHVVHTKKDREILEEKIRKILKALRDPETNKRVVDHMWSKEEVYHGKYMDDAPDVLFSMGNYSYASSMRFAFATNKLFAPTLTFKSGEHKPEGILILYGSQFRHETKRKKVNINDLSGLIQTFFGYPDPKNKDSRTYRLFIRSFKIDKPNVGSNMVKTITI